MKGETDHAHRLRRDGRLIAAVLGLAHITGSVFIFLYLNLIAPAEPVEGGSFALDLLYIALYLAVSVPVTGRWLSRTAFRALRWKEEDRAPSPDERRATLALPFTLSAKSLVPWIGAMAVFGATNVAYGHTLPHVLKVAFVVVDGGIIAATASYFFLHRACRPAIAEALAGSPPERGFLGVKSRLVLGWALGSGVFFAGLTTLPLARMNATERTDIAAAVIVLSVAGLVVGGLITLASAGTVAQPLASVREALARVEQGNLTVEVPVDAPGELGMLQAGVNRMVHGLRERQRLADLFGRHVGKEVAERALEQGSGLESEQREASALFVDVIGSTAMAEVLPPSEVVATLNAYFGCVVRVVGDEGGWVNKFEGDGALCVFGAPAVQPDHATRALRAARRLRLELDELRSAHPGLEAAIGVSSGTVVAGNVGTESRYEYTVIGGPVNEAARLTDLAKSRPGRVLASSATTERADADERSRWNDRGTVALRGRAAPSGVYEPDGRFFTAAG